VALAKGLVLDGRFQLAELLGRGSFGEVWGAIRLQDRKRVAVKVLRPELIDQEEIVRRFDREQRCGGLVRNKHVAPVHEACTAGGWPLYLVTDWYRGETLLARLTRDKYLSFGEAAPLFEDLLIGLEAIHAARVIHRDLKPANIFLARRTRGALRAVILDFGVAKLLGERDMNTEMLTAKGATLGSLSFMAPEQVNGSIDADVRADLYGVGVMLYRALTGVLPHAPSTPAELLAMKLDRDAPSLGAATGDRWPARLEALTARLLARSRNLRTATATEALAELRSIRAIHPSIDFGPSGDQENDDLEAPPTETGALVVPPARRSR
jgi:eukaryotic-like serine/threonine-protein kinase